MREETEGWKRRTIGERYMEKESHKWRKKVIDRRVELMEKSTLFRA